MLHTSDVASNRKNILNAMAMETLIQDFRSYHASGTKDDGIHTQDPFNQKEKTEFTTANIPRGISWG